jgi:hypothetical protein
VAQAYNYSYLGGGDQEATSGKKCAKPSGQPIQVGHGGSCLSSQRCEEAQIQEDLSPGQLKARPSLKNDQHRLGASGSCL